MGHLVLAAQTLIHQVDDRRSRMSWTGGERDGINRIRSVEFDVRTSKWLAPILEACADPRISDLTVNGKNRLTVTFVSTTKADDRTPFQLDEADSVLNADENEDGHV